MLIDGGLSLEDDISCTEFNLLPSTSTLHGEYLVSKMEFNASSSKNKKKLRNAYLADAYTLARMALEDFKNEQNR